MQAEPDQVGYFLLRWASATTGGWVFGNLLGFIMGHMWEGVLGHALGVLGAYLTWGAVFGFVHCSMQWLVLRRRAAWAGRWIYAGIAGFAMAGASAALLTGFSQSSGVGPGWVVPATFGGAVTGVLQWLVLREQITRAGWWVSASTAGYGLCMTVSIADFNRLLSMVGGGLVLGVVTGGVLVWLLRQPVSDGR